MARHPAPSGSPSYICPPWPLASPCSMLSAHTPGLLAPQDLGMSFLSPLPGRLWLSPGGSLSLPSSNSVPGKATSSGKPSLLSAVKRDPSTALPSLMLTFFHIAQHLLTSSFASLFWLISSSGCKPHDGRNFFLSCLLLHPPGATAEQCLAHRGPSKIFFERMSEGVSILLSRGNSGLLSCARGALSFPVTHLPRTLGPSQAGLVLPDSQCLRPSRLSDTFLSFLSLTFSYIERAPQGRA